MKEFDFQKLIAYYGKVAAGCLKFGGRDWRYGMYQDRLDRIVELSTSPKLSREDCQYLEARSAIAATF